MTDEETCITCGDIAIAMRVVRTAGEDLAECVSDDGEVSTVDITLVDAAPGDRVLVHACVAIQCLSAPHADGVGVRR